ncbi:hypothetical protein ACE1CI_00875 [Aerosakkonemataceae cyanobacterium BLCC-F50]|uniref:Secreted protein n=1 Tax=Floridaenema flaviceps BLCC-F50 TaxID=3153642 RepID=A0ABV4XJ72_9CYAN
MQCSLIKRLLIVFVTIAFTIGLSSINHSSATQTTQATPAIPAATGNQPKTCVVGVYLTSIGDFNPAEKSFAATFWIWSVCPTSDLKPLKSLEVIKFQNTKLLG